MTTGYWRAPSHSPVMNRRAPNLNGHEITGPGPGDGFNLPDTVVLPHQPRHHEREPCHYCGTAPLRDERLVDDVLPESSWGT